MDAGKLFWEGDFVFLIALSPTEKNYLMTTMSLSGETSPPKHDFIAPGHVLPGLFILISSLFTFLESLSQIMLEVHKKNTNTVFIS